MAFYLSNKNKRRLSLAYILILTLFAIYAYKTYANLQENLRESQIQSAISDYKLYLKIYDIKIQKDILIENPSYNNNDEFIDEYSKVTPLYINKEAKQDAKYNLTFKFFDKNQRHSIETEEKISKLKNQDYFYIIKENHIDFFGKIYTDGYVNIVKQFKHIFIVKEILNSSITFVFIVSMINVFIFFYLLSLFDEHEDIQKQMHSQYEKLSLDAKSIALFDTLTGAATRIKFNEDLNNLLQLASRFKEQTFCLMILDIDNFKRVNDTYGHDYGDIVLKAIASTIQQNIRKTDFFYRWGGEEFIILMPMNKLDKALVLAEKLREKISQTRFEKIEQITCSFGLVEHNFADSETTIVKRADELLYLAKKKGKNRVEYEL